MVTEIVHYFALARLRASRVFESSSWAVAFFTIRLSRFASRALTACRLVIADVGNLAMMPSPKCCL